MPHALSVFADACFLLQGEHCCFLLHNSPSTAAISHDSRSPWLRQIGKIIYKHIPLLLGLQGLPESYFFRVVFTHPSTSLSGLLAKDSSACKAVGACLGEGSAGSSDNQHQNSTAKFAALMGCQRKSAKGRAEKQEIFTH